MKHFVYTHRRRDTNKIFYIGIGTKSERNYKTLVSIYYRAHTKKGRNQHWLNITKQIPYNVVIVFESDDYNKCKQEEIRLIASTKESLCNVTGGGDGTLNVPKPKSGKSKFSKRIYQYNLEGIFLKEWACGKDIERTLGFISQSIYDCCNLKAKNKTAYGYQWSYSKTILKKVKRYSNRNIKAIVQLTVSGEFVKEWNSIVEAANELKIARSHISSCCNNKRKSAGNFKWKFK